MPRGWLVTVGCLLGACGAGARPPRELVPIRLLVIGDAASIASRAWTFDEVDGVRFAPATLPESTPVAPPEPPQIEIAAARDAYIAADFAACQAALAEVDPPALLAAGHRELAARVLLYRVACHVNAGEPARAGADAAAFAAAGLTVPLDELVTPDVEALLVAAADAIAGRSASLQVRSDPVGARVAVDGAAEECATPCTLTLRPGVHAIGLAADGRAATWRRVTVPADRELAVELAAAEPEQAAAQLLLRLARGGAIDDATSLALAGQAVRARRLVVVDASLHARGVRLIAALVADGRPAARAERIASEDRLTAAERGLAHELLAEGGVVPPRAPLWRRPWFWASVAGAAAVGAAVTAYLVFRPDPETEVVFP